MKKTTKIAVSVLVVLGAISGVAQLFSPPQQQDNIITTEAVSSAPPVTSVSETVLETTAKEEDVIFDFSSYDTAYENVDTGSLTIKHGELLSVIYSDGTVIVKAKIEPSYNNEATISQNYFNIADLVKNHGFNTCKKLSYWAVADMTNGEEAKCISFDLDKEIIDNLYNGNIVENQLGDYATDLWILPSLTK